jgi:hypothetical protein
MKSKEGQNLVIKNISKTTSEAINLMMKVMNKTTVSDTVTSMIDVLPVMMSNNLEIYKKLKELNITIDEQITLFHKDKFVFIRI